MNDNTQDYSIRTFRTVSELSYALKTQYDRSEDYYIDPQNITYNADDGIEVRQWKYNPRDFKKEPHPISFKLNEYSLTQFAILFGLDFDKINGESHRDITSVVNLGIDCAEVNQTLVRSTTPEKGDLYEASAILPGSYNRIDNLQLINQLLPETVRDEIFPRLYDHELTPTQLRKKKEEAKNSSNSEREVLVHEILNNSNFKEAVLVDRKLILDLDLEPKDHSELRFLLRISNDDLASDSFSAEILYSRRNGSYIDSEWPALTFSCPHCSATNYPKSIPKFPLLKSIRSKLATSLSRVIAQQLKTINGEYGAGIGISNFFAILDTVDLNNHKVSSNSNLIDRHSLKTIQAFKNLMDKVKLVKDGEKQILSSDHKNLELLKASPELIETVENLFERLDLVKYKELSSGKVIEIYIGYLIAGKKPTLLTLYLALETYKGLVENGPLTEADHKGLEDNENFVNYQHLADAIHKGLEKMVSPRYNLSLTPVYNFRRENLPEEQHILRLINSVLNFLKLDNCRKICTDDIYQCYRKEIEEGGKPTLLSIFFAFCTYATINLRQTAESSADPFMLSDKLSAKANDLLDIDIGYENIAKPFRVPRRRVTKFMPPRV